MLRNWLRSLFSTRKNPIGRTARRRPTFRPSLEELESRLTPTIVFKPHFGAESAVDNGGFKLDRDPVNLIFWGSYWKAAVNPSENDLVNAFTSVLSGPYFKSLSQYGVNGADASIQSVISNSPDPVNGFDHGDIQDVIMNAIDNQGLAEPDAGNYDNALYVVITPPGIGSDRGSSVYGYNNCFHSGSLLDPDLAIYAWVGIPAAGNLKDVATCVFSHEVAEALTDPKQGNGISVTASPNFSASVPGYASPDQICDFEPEIDVGYTYRVNGQLVPAYWSQQDNAFVIPDGTRQQFILNPIWNGGNFTGTYDLTVNGDQLGANYNDQVVIGVDTQQDVDAGGVWVSLNGEGAQFEPGTIHSITLNTGGGADSVTNDLPAGFYVPVYEVPGGVARVTVTSGAAGPVSVNNQGQPTFSVRQADGSVVYLTDYQFSVGPDGTLSVSNPFGTYPIASNVASFASSDSDYVFDLKTDGTLYAQYGDGHATYLDSGVSAIAGSGGSYCFKLATDGRLYAQYGDSASDCTYLDSGVSAIAGSGSSFCFELGLDGRLWTMASDGTQTQLDSGVSAIASSGGPACFELGLDGRLWAMAGDGEQTQLDSGVSAIASSGGPQCFELALDGRLWTMSRDGLHDTYLDSGVSAIAGSGGPACFELGLDGRLWAMASDGAQTQLDSGVSAIAGSGGPRVFDLHTDGSLYAQTLAPAGYMDGGAAWLDTNVLSIADAGGPRVFDLHTNGWLYAQTLAPAGYMDGGAATLDSNVASIVATAGPRAFDLHTDGTLYAQTLAPAGYMDGGAATLDRSVSSIAGSGGPRVFDLHANGTLYSQTLAPAGYMDGGASTLDHNVLSIADAGGPRVFDLHANGTLYAQTLAPAGYMDGGAATLDTNVASIAGTDGPRVFDLHTGGSLYAQTLAPAGYMDGGAATLDSNVASIASSGGPRGFVLHADGTLTTQTLAPAGYMDGGSGSVASNIASIASSGGPSVYSLTRLGVAAWTVNQSGFAGTITISGGDGSYSNLAVTGLPPGLTATLAGNTISISGTPTRYGVYPSIVVAVQTDTGSTLSGTYALTINSPPTITSGTPPAFTMTQQGSFLVTATGFPAPTFSASGLPQGLTLDPATGWLRGTPALGTNGTYAVTLTASNGIGANATQSFTLTVNVPPHQAPAITSTNQATFTVGWTTFFDVAATGFPLPTFSEAGTLPAGVTFGPATGVLGGTPAVGSGGIYTFTITAANGIGSNAVQTFILTVNEALTITSSNTATFTVNQTGSFAVTATGFPAPTFRLTRGTLPSGVTCNPTTGVLSGTPAAGTAGVYQFTIIAGNAAGLVASQSFTLTVNQAPAITSANTTAFVVGQSDSFTVTATGFPAPTFSVVGTLPRGITLNSTTGGLGGIPSSSAVGTYTFTIQASNGVTPVASQNFTLTISQPQAPVITSANATTFTAGTAGSFQVTATGFPAPGFGISGTLPSGVTFNRATGVLSGTPAANTVGVYKLTITASNSLTAPASQTFTLTVNTPAIFTSANAATFTVGQKCSFTVKTSGLSSPTYALIGLLPSGLTFNASTGLLSGTPLAGTDGAYTFTITATDNTGLKITQTFTLTIIG